MTNDEIQEYLAEEELITNAIKTNARTITMLIETFKNLHYLSRETILNSIKNHSLLFCYCKSGFANYHCIGDAITNKGKGILLCFIDLGLYAVATTKESVDKFISNRFTNIDADSVVNINQIVLEQDQQKVIFIVRDKPPNVIKNICQTVETSLDSTTKVTSLGRDTQVQVNKTVANYKQVEAVYKQILSCVAQFNRHLVQDITLPRYNYSEATRYWSHNVNNSICDDLWSHLLVHVGDITINNNIGVLNNVGVNNGIVNNNIACSPEDMTAQWVTINDPTNIPSKKYYEKYVNETIAPRLGVQEFPKEVEKLGFERIRKKGKTIWVKCGMEAT